MPLCREACAHLRRSILRGVRMPLLGHERAILERAPSHHTPTVSQLRWHTISGTLCGCADVLRTGRDRAAFSVRGVARSVRSVTVPWVCARRCARCADTSSLVLTHAAYFTKLMELVRAPFLPAPHT
eukprot:7260976-Prymnesium_polylepis.2